MHLAFKKEESIFSCYNFSSENEIRLILFKEKGKEGTLFFMKMQKCYLQAGMYTGM